MSQDSRPRRPAQQRRGEELRRHILVTAKDVFLETGYERASMDTVASRAQTSKRSLYAHFANKDNLFLAVLDFARELYLEKLRTPDAYAERPAEAVTLFCARFLQLMVWEPQVRTCRLSIAEAERLPGSSSAYYEAIFISTHERLVAYLDERYDIAPGDSGALAQDLLDRTVLPRLFRALLGVDAATTTAPDAVALADTVDLDTIRALVTGALPPERK
ncbi:TetR/AcrR family transcriptional regulator [Streptomyces sp. 8L]|uniref:TetR/AcrR family transcriptional regulator n=1 Tax=Streptomyces sp. 8L TaxID=2877242 RepID=UPI001CD80CBB|nr:TetR/AcrR family transcriptional regulator [Streptomyces sp. 8L]MCA1218360.1 TetR/AcrR family transcriptional regulator [Streptomyces sp. 8L]